MGHSVLEVDRFTSVDTIRNHIGLGHWLFFRHLNYLPRTQYREGGTTMEVENHGASGRNAASVWSCDWGARCVSRRGRASGGAHRDGVIFVNKRWNSSRP